MIAAFAPKRHIFRLFPPVHPRLQNATITAVKIARISIKITASDDEKTLKNSSLHANDGLRPVIRFFGERARRAPACAVRHAPHATDTFKHPAGPETVGIRPMASHFSRVSRRKPPPSPPKTQHHPLPPTPPPTHPASRTAPARSRFPRRQFVNVGVAVLGGADNENIALAQIFQRPRQISHADIRQNLRRPRRRLARRRRQRRASAARRKKRRPRQKPAPSATPRPDFAGRSRRPAPQKARRRPPRIFAATHPNPPPPARFPRQSPDDAHRPSISTIRTPKRTPPEFRSAARNPPTPKPGGCGFRRRPAAAATRPTPMRTPPPALRGKSFVAPLFSSSAQLWRSSPVF